MADADELMIRLIKLEAENSYLKSLLEQAGIEYEPFDTDSQSPDASFIRDQGSRILPQKSQAIMLAGFTLISGAERMFTASGRKNKTTGRAAYYPQCDNFWKRGICPKASGKKIKCKDCNNRRWTRLESAQIENHLRGLKEDASDVIGIYPLFPDGTCRLLVFDFDNHDSGAEDQDYANTDNSWIEEVDALREIGKEIVFPCWWNDPVRARERMYGYSLMRRFPQPLPVNLVFPY